MTWETINNHAYLESRLTLAVSDAGKPIDGLQLRRGLQSLTPFKPTPEQHRARTFLFTDRLWGTLLTGLLLH